MSSASVIIGADGALEREGLAALLGREPALDVVGFSPCQDELVALARDKGADVVLFGVRAFASADLELVRRMLDARPGIGVLLMGRFEAPDDVLPFLCAGARGCISSDATVGALRAAIESVAFGQSVIPPAILSAALCCDPTKTHQSKLERLSNRERELLGYLSAGQTVGFAARQMKVSNSAASTYRRRIMEKLGVQTNADFIRYILTHTR